MLKYALIYLLASLSYMFEEGVGTLSSSDGSDPAERIGLMQVGNQELLQYLIENGVVEKHFPENKPLGFDSIAFEEYAVGYVQIAYYESSDRWNVEPVYNLLFLKSNGEFCYSIIPSSYPDDFGFLKQSDLRIVFEHYSSAVGFRKYYVFDKKRREFWISGRYDESETIVFRDAEDNIEFLRPEECF